MIQIDEHCSSAEGDDKAKFGEDQGVTNPCLMNDYSSSLEIRANELMIRLISMRFYEKIVNKLTVLVFIPSDACSVAVIILSNSIPKFLFWVFAS